MTKIEFLRRTTGLSQSELGRRLGINPSSIAQLERGHRKSWPKLRRQLAEQFEADEYELFDEAGWPTKVQRIV